MNSEDVKTRSEWVYWCNGCSVRRVESPSLLCSHCKLERELAAANERIRRLVEAGDEIAFRLRESVFTEDEVAIEEWDHAKEAKP